MMLDAVREQTDEFDVLHFHIDLLHFPLIRDFADRTVTTLRGRLDLPDLKPFYADFPEVPLVSISRDQHRPFAYPINWGQRLSRLAAICCHSPLISKAITWPFWDGFCRRSDRTAPLRSPRGPA